MNPRWFGDSYDIVKRVFIDVLKVEGYTVYVDPMFTGNDTQVERDYYHLIGAEPLPADSTGSKKMAIFVDPDTGIGETTINKHVTVQNLVNRLQVYTMVMVFDQSFSRGRDCDQQMHQKLTEFYRQEVFGFYFNSHAKFFFGSRDKSVVEDYRNKLLEMGIPAGRLPCSYKTD